MQGARWLMAIRGPVRAPSDQDRPAFRGPAAERCLPYEVLGSVGSCWLRLAVG